MEVEGQVVLKFEIADLNDLSQTYTISHPKCLIKSNPGGKESFRRSGQVLKRIENVQESSDYPKLSFAI